MKVSPRYLDHARHPRNLGDPEDANGVMINVQDCGDIVMFFVKVNNLVLEKVNFLVQGCHNLIACCSMLTVLAKGKTIWEAMEITPDQLAHALGGLPPEEMHTAGYACDALYGAIQNYLARAKKEGAPDLQRSLRGEGWRSLYISAQRGEQPLENIYQRRKENTTN